MKASIPLLLLLFLSLILYVYRNPTCKEEKHDDYIHVSIVHDTVFVHNNDPIYILKNQSK